MILGYIKTHTHIRYYDPIPCHTSLYFSILTILLSLRLPRQLQQFCFYFHTHTRFYVFIENFRTANKRTHAHTHTHKCLSAIDLFHFNSYR